MITTDDYDAANNKVIAGIKLQCNHAMMKFKLFTDMPQEEEPFAGWWATVKEQADKCDFIGYNAKQSARDAILFQTSSTKLRKRILAEDLDLDDVVRMGLAMEQSNRKAGNMAVLSPPLCPRGAQWRG